MDGTDNMKKSNKKLEEKIQNVIGNPFDSTHIMRVFEKELRSLFREIRGEVAREKWYEDSVEDAMKPNFVTKEELRAYDEGIDTALEVIGMIEEERSL